MKILESTREEQVLLGLDRKKLAEEYLTLELRNINGIVDKWRITNFRILKEILSTRGLTRWLSFHFLSSTNPIYLNSYQMNRMKLLFRMAFDFRSVRKNILRRIKLTSLSENQIRKATFLDSSNYINVKESVDFQENQLYVLDQELSRLKNYRVIDKKTKSVILKLANWHTAALVEFVISSQRSKVFEDKYSKLLPYLIKEIQKFAIKEIARFPNANLSFDELVINKNNSKKDYWETIDDVSIWHERIMIKNNQIILIDDTADPRLPFVGGQWHIVKAKSNSST